jgi:hypothetical protein
MPRRVSTEFRGEIDGVEGKSRGLRGVGVVEIGGVPKERAAMTS